jgi:glycerophosphoryl diester phosphodiesterase
MPRTPAKVFAGAPVLCGHRGSGAGVIDGHRENTLGSFRAAVAAGLRWVEVDARLTADGVLVALHDPAVEDGRFVAELAATETDALGLTRLADLLEDLPVDVAVDVDVKTSIEDALRPRERTTGALVADMCSRETRTVLITSFDPSALLIAREVAPELPLGLLTWIRFPLRKAIAAAAQMGLDVVAPHYESFRLGDPARARYERAPDEVVGLAHAAGLEVLAWSPPPVEAEALIAAGVDCVVVDDVPAAVYLHSGAALTRQERLA